MKYFKVILLSLTIFLAFCVESLGYSEIKCSPKSCYYIQPIFASFDKASYPKESWIGLYTKDAKYYDYTDIYYLKDLKDNIFATYSPSINGDYEFRIYDTKFKLLSKSNVVQVTKRPITVIDEVYSSSKLEPKVSIYVKSINEKSKIFVDYANIDVNCHNYIGLYEKDALDNSSIELQKAPQKSSGLLSFSMPRSDKQYEFRIFNSDYYSLVYKSDIFKLEQLVKTNFTDLKVSDPAYRAIKYLNERGLISELKNNTIRPNDKITRAEFAKFLYTCLNLKPSEDKQFFADVNSKNLSYKYVQAGRNYINCYSDKSHVYFRPNSYVTKEEVANALVKGFRLSDANVNLKSLQQFSDYKSISPKYVKNVAIAVKNSVFGKVDKNFEPKKAVTRGELSIILRNLMDR